MLGKSGQNALGESALQNVMSLWSGLDLRRRMIIVGATLAMFLAIIGLSRMANTPGMALLYAGLDASAAGDVVAALEQSGVAFEVRGDSILVDQAQRDSLRMTLATEGLPATGGEGYELLDSLSGFGTTSQMFDAAYWRAKEGELARTILASPQIKAARVHIAQAPAQAFRRDERPTASVTVTTAARTLPESQARALQHLVAAAVTGMTPEDVQIIDSVGGLISVRPQDGTGGSGEDRAGAIRRNVERLLEARVGPGKAVVEVAVDVVTDRESITERTFDPASRVAISSETEERTGTSSEPGGDVTVASNLPDGAAGAGANGKTESAQTSERVNYEVSETNRELLRGPGAVRKLSVAVLVDGQTVTAEDGTTTWQPRSDDELATLRELVASAVGLDEGRGDVLTLKTLEFQSVPVVGTEASSSYLPALGPINVMSAIQIAVLALVVLVLGLFVIRPVLTSAARGQALPPPSPQLALPGTAEPARVVTGEIDDGSGLPPIALVGSSDAAGADPVARLRRLIEERQTESVEILRGWMELDEERR
ncbi:MAG: flagellar basal-body MS-ring/collar protein FliF [Pseudomonadota bacterium]